MDTVICPRCGATIPSSSAFCGVCGTPLSAQPSGTAVPQQPTPPAESAPPQAGQQFSGGQPLPPPGSYPPPGGAFPPPPGAYPPGFAGTKVVGDSTKWAIGLGVAALFCCGPLTAIPGFLLAKKDMDEFASGRAPHLDVSWSKMAYYLNIIALILFVAGICLFWGRLAPFRHF
jgi:zinc-ribbon domain